MKINLGAGNDTKDGYINHDITKHSDKIDIAIDLNLDNWSEAFLRSYNELFDEVCAFDVIEHLDDPVQFLNNCWELLKKGGVLKLKACGWQNPNFWVDPTHKKGYDIKSFDFFDPDTELGKRYSYYTEKKWMIVSVNYDRRMNVIVEMEPRK